MTSLPQLTSPPVNTRVLAFLSVVAGDALTRHLGVILPALLSSLKSKLDTEDGEQVKPHNCYIGGDLRSLSLNKDYMDHYTITFDKDENCRICSIFDQMRLRR